MEVRTAGHWEGQENWGALAPHLIFSHSSVSRCLDPSCATSWRCDQGQAHPLSGHQ